MTDGGNGPMLLAPARRSATGDDGPGDIDTGMGRGRPGVATRDDFAMPPLERPVFDLPMPASRWRWRG